MDKTKRSGSKLRWMRRLAWTMLVMIPVSVLIVLALFGARLSSSAQETRLSGAAATQWIETLMNEPLPSAYDVTYYEVRKTVDSFEAKMQFKIEPQGYQDFIAQAAPLCFTVPLLPEGDQTTQQGIRCDEVRMHITVDKSSEQVWQVTIDMKSFR